MTDPGKRQFISVIELCSEVCWWLLLCSEKDKARVGYKNWALAVESCVVWR